MEDMLDKVPYTPLVQLGPTIQFVFAVGNKKDNEVLAKKIYDRAVQNQDLCVKYLELVKFVSNNFSNIRNDDFKDVFLECCINNFKIDCFTCAVEKKCYEAASFFGQLFNTDLATSSLTHYWAISLNNKQDVQSVLLKTIKQKVLSEYAEKYFNADIHALRNLLIIRQQHFESSSSSESSEYFNHHVEETYSESESEEEVPLASRSSTPMPEAFKEFLEKVDEVPKPNFDLRRFKTSNDEERKKCAKAMLEQALLKPRQSKSYADVVREILCSHSVSSKYQKTFGNYLGDICETEIEKLFKQGSTRDWIKINGLGVFLSELYTREGLKNQQMNKWLENVQKIVAQNNTQAIEVQLTSLKIILPKMKFRDVQSHKFYLQQIKALYVQGRIPPVFLQWTRETTGLAVLLTGTTPASTSSLNNKPALEAIKM